MHEMYTHTHYLLYRTTLHSRLRNLASSSVQSFGVDGDDFMRLAWMNGWNLGRVSVVLVKGLECGTHGAMFLSAFSSGDGRDCGVGVMRGYFREWKGFFLPLAAAALHDGQAKSKSRVQHGF